MAVDVDRVIVDEEKACQALMVAPATLPGSRMSECMARLACELPVACQDILIIPRAFNSWLQYGDVVSTAARMLLGSDPAIIRAGDVAAYGFRPISSRSVEASERPSPSAQGELRSLPSKSGETDVEVLMPC